MKLVGVILLFASALIAVQAAKTCTEMADCDSKECCLNLNIGKAASYCERRFEPNERCIAEARYGDDGKDMYNIACPCKQGYECLGKGELDENGNTVIKHPKCIVPT